MDETAVSDIYSTWVMLLSFLFPWLFVRKISGHPFAGSAILLKYSLLLPYVPVGSISQQDNPVQEIRVCISPLQSIALTDVPALKQGKPINCRDGNDLFRHGFSSWPIPERFLHQSVIHKPVCHLAVLPVIKRRLTFQFNNISQTPSQTTGACKACSLNKV